MSAPAQAPLYCPECTAPLLPGALECRGCGWEAPRADPGPPPAPPKPPAAVDVEHEAPAADVPTCEACNARLRPRAMRCACGEPVPHREPARVVVGRFDGLLEETRRAHPEFERRAGETFDAYRERLEPVVRAGVAAIADNARQAPAVQPRALARDGTAQASGKICATLRGVERALREGAVAGRVALVDALAAVRAVSPGPGGILPADVPTGTGPPSGAPPGPVLPSAREALEALEQLARQLENRGMAPEHAVRTAAATVLRRVLGGAS